MSQRTATAQQLSLKHRRSSGAGQALVPSQPFRPPLTVPRSHVTRWVGLDVHAADIAVAIAERDGAVYSYGTIAHTPETIRTVMKKLRADDHVLTACYEAGPTGYGLHRLLEAMGIPCLVAAPSLIPKAAGARIKTDRRDAQKLARLHRSGDLTAVWVPDATHEALRDLVRAREGAMYDRTRARHRVTKLLLRYSVRRPENMKAWTTRHRTWLVAHVTKLPCFQADHLQLTLTEYLHEIDHHTERLARYDAAILKAVTTAPPMLQATIGALQALRGVSLLTATTIALEVSLFSRFANPQQLMSYAGLVPSERSSGTRTRRGGITKHGNTHLRRILVEAAWAYRFRAKLTPAVQRRAKGQSEEIKSIAWTAQQRLCARYRVLARHKLLPQVIAAIGRELLGFTWAIGVAVERLYLSSVTPATQEA